MKMKKIILFLSGGTLLLLSGCAGVELPLGSILKAGSTAAVGYAAYELAPEDWKDSEKAALVAGSAFATWIVGEMVEGKIKKDIVAASDAGFAAGRAHGARTAYQIIQGYQKSNGEAGSVKVIALPAPAVPGVNQVPHDVFMEVLE